MLNKSVARRYAEALFSIAKEENNIDQYQNQFKLVIDTVKEIEGFKEYLDNFLIPGAEKKQLLKRIFASELAAKMLTFLYIVVDKKREVYLELIYHEFVELADEFRNIKKAELFTAREISDADLNALAENLSKATGKTIRFQHRVEPELIGGIKIKIDDKIIDATIKKRLQLLGENLKFAKIS